MCGKLGNNEVETVENMMSMVVCMVIADTFETDMDTLQPDTALIADLGMTKKLQRELKSALCDMFDDAKMDFKKITTVQDVIEQVARVQLH
jgi:acyl carrier protein